MKNVITYYNASNQLTTSLQDIPTLTASSLAPNELLLRVRVAASNPKDWKHPMPNYFNNALNQGDDCVGTIAALGSAVHDFQLGERVAGFHQMDTLRGTYAELAVCPAHTVFRLPEHVSDEEGATVPLAAFTAAVGLFRNLELPMPFARGDENAPRAGRKVPLIVNGAGSAVGAFAVKLAKLTSGIGPVVATAGGSRAYVEQLGADSIVDYRSETVVEDLRAALGGRKIYHVFDASNSVASVKYLTAVLEKGGSYTATTGLVGAQKEILEEAGVWHEQIWVGSVHDEKPAGGILFAAVMSKIFEITLAEGKLSGHPYEVIPNGLAGVGEALLRLRDRKGGNAKFVYRISETPGL